MRFRTEYSDDHDEVSLATSLRCEDASLTKQEFKDDTDINVLVRRFGVVPLAAQHHQVPMYSDFSDVVDYQSAMNAILAADEAFMTLPPDLRARYDNNPQLLLEAIDRREFQPLYDAGLRAVSPATKPDSEVIIEPSPGKQEAPTT